MKDYLAAVRRLPPSKQEAVLAGLDALIERVETANNLEWLPISTNLELTEAVFTRLGDEQAELFYQNWLKRQMSAPAFAGLVRTALALFRFDTVALAKWIPKAFDIMYKDYGSFEIQELGDGQLNVELCGMPPELLAHRNWHRSVASGLYALFFLTGAKGSTELEPLDAQKRSIRIALRWTQ
jgi:hypothetical protein